MMLLKYGLTVTIAMAVIIGLVSCGANRRTSPAADKSYIPTPTSTDLTQGWSLHFCTDQTIEDNVSIEIGRAGDDASHRVWRSVNPRTDPKLILPDDLRFVDKLWIKVTAENHRDVDACVKYDGNAAEKLFFNESAEESIDRTSTEDCGC